MFVTYILFNLSEISFMWLLKWGNSFHFDSLPKCFKILKMPMQYNALAFLKIKKKKPAHVTFLFQQAFQSWYQKHIGD